MSDVGGTRWRHVRAVGTVAEEWARTRGISNDVVRAAWWHDIGSMPNLIQTGHHAIDGARYLRDAGLSETVVSLVAWHTGSIFEARELGLESDLREFAEPVGKDLDMLTMLDLSRGPDGRPSRDSERINEIRNRYTEQDPVYRSVSIGRQYLMNSSSRAKASLGLPNDWPVST